MTSPPATDPGTGWARLRARLDNPQTWIAIFSIFTVALVALVDTDRTSPGPVSAVHATVEELEGGTNCAACHGGLFGDQDSSCLDCHAVIAEQLEGGTGLHGTIAEDRRSSCAVCHSEHHGLAFSPVNRASFAAAGLGDRDGLDHEPFGFAMEGAHLELDCAACHVNADIEVLPAGETRFLGLDASCVSCHEDAHEGALGSSCADCHDQADFAAPRSADHSRVLDLVGPHAGIDCRSCHGEGEAHSLEALASEASPPAGRRCADCHESPHDPNFLSGVARAVAQPAEAACATCHIPQHLDFHGAPAAPAGDVPVPPLERLVTPKLHDAAGFGLRSPHADLSCSACHLGPSADFDARFPGRPEASCSSCHEGPHGDQFSKGRFAGRECTACHDRESFEEDAFDVAAHRRTAFALEASHAELACNACHLDPPEEEPRRFHGTPKRCELCHADAHGGFFDTFLADRKDERRRGTCSVCHVSTTFDDVETEDPETARSFDHGVWTGFELRGAHLQERCETCHVPTGTRDATGRRFGRVETSFGTVTGCASCHGDPHEGLFDAPGLPTRRNGGSDCLRCHSETSFRAMPNRFEHGLWTGFDLDGAHAKTGCESCHTPRVRPDAVGRTWGAARGTACGACHTNPHAGQFRDETGATDCASCHRSAVGWDALRFDHERQSRFPLGSAHAKVECSACHTAQKLESGGVIVRYRPLETSCDACHDAQRGGGARSRGRRRF